VGAAFRPSISRAKPQMGGNRPGGAAKLSKMMPRFSKLEDFDDINRAAQWAFRMWSQPDDCVASKRSRGRLSLRHKSRCAKVPLQIRRPDHRGSLGRVPLLSRFEALAGFSLGDRQRVFTPKEPWTLIKRMPCRLYRDLYQFRCSQVFTRRRAPRLE